MDVFPDLERADVIKIDIEGSECPSSEPPFEELRALGIALEYHLQRRPFDYARSTAHAVSASSGYDVEEIEVPPAPPGVGMLWACRVAGPPRDDSIASRNSSA